MAVYLRLSVTDRCNFRCSYCRPDKAVAAERGTALEHAELLSLVWRVHRRGRIRKLRLSGGEPLLAPNPAKLVSELRRLLPAAELALTTNGYLLSNHARELKQAGLDRLNVSLDTASPAQFAALTGVDGLSRVIAGIESARAAGFERLKLNAVLLRSSGPERLLELVRFAQSHGAELRLIELMPLGAAAPLFEREYWSATSALESLRRKLPWLGPMGRQGTALRHRFRVAGDEVVIGLISPVSEPFCTGCDRLRLDSWGRLYSCLRRARSAQLAQPLREERIDELDRAIDLVLRRKRLPGPSWPRTQMAAIGG